MRNRGALAADKSRMLDAETLDLPIEVVTEEQLLERAYGAPTLDERIAAWSELQRVRAMRAARAAPS